MNQKIFVDIFNEICYNVLCEIIRYSSGTRSAKNSCLINFKEISYVILL